MIETGTLLQDRYLIEKQIGEGGMGAVYLAVDRRFDNHVAIKETFYKDEELGEAFEREARLLNALQHPVLPHVSDYFTERNGYFLVMQYIEGDDLSDVLKRAGVFAFDDVVRWIDQLLDALDYLHSQEPPIIHRDIKPHNLKLTTRGDVMLLDFGLAKLNAEDTTGAISVFGYSRTYSPLEQIQGTGTDARSDIFALGATAYHLLTGKAPVDALTRAAAIVNGQPDPLVTAAEINAAVPEPVASVIDSALALNPQNRFVSAGAMRRALNHALSEQKEGILTAEESAPVVVAAASPEQAIDTSENANFAALEAFAAETLGAGAVAEKAADKPETGAAETDRSDEKTPAVEPVSDTVLVDAPISAAPPKSTVTSSAGRRPVVYAALAALIVAIAAGIWYLAGRGDANARSEESPVAGATPPAVTAEPDTAARSESVAERIETVPAAVEREKPVREEPKTTSDESAKRDGAESNAETAEPAAPPAARTEPARNNQPVRRRQQTVDNGETRERTVNEEEPSDASQIETIFSGREQRRPSNGRENRRRDRREIPDEMTEEEFEQLRRERRERRERRRARRQDPIPF